MFDKDWIENKGLDVNIKTPTKGSRIWYKDASFNVLTTQPGKIFEFVIQLLIK